MFQIQNLLRSVFFNYFCSNVGFNLTEALKVAAGTGTLSHFAISSVVFIAFLTLPNDTMIPTMLDHFFICAAKVTI